jgi:hypothetical protein
MARATLERVLLRGEGSNDGLRKKFNRVGYAANRAALRREFPEVRWQSLAQWAGTQDWPTVLSGKWERTARLL